MTTPARAALALSTLFGVNFTAVASADFAGSIFTGQKIHFVADADVPAIDTDTIPLDFAGSLLADIMATGPRDVSILLVDAEA